MRTLSVAGAVVAAAVVVLGAGCAGQHAAPGAGRPAGPVPPGTAAPASAVPATAVPAKAASAADASASAVPPSTAPPPAPGSVPGSAVPGGIFGRAFTKPTLTVAGGGLYLSWDESSPQQVPPQVVLARADAATGQILAENQFIPGYVSIPLYAAGSLWVTDTASTTVLLIRLDPRTLMVTGELEVAGAGAGSEAYAHAAFAADSIWVDGAGRLTQVSLASMAVERTIRLDGAVSSDVGASPDGGTLIVSEADDGGAGTVQRRDPVTGVLLASHPMAGVVAPTIGGVSGAGAWIAEPTGMMGYVERFRTPAMTPDQATQVEGTNAIMAQIWDGVLWVTNPVGGASRNYCADPGTGHRLAAIPFPDPFQDSLLAVNGRDLFYAHWTNDGDGVRISAAALPAACLAGR